MAEIHRVGDNNISVYLRPHKSGECYYARYKIANKRVANNQRYVTESLKTTSLSIAKDRARQRYAEITLLERQGVSLKSGSVSSEIDAFYSEYENGVSQKLSGYSRNMLVSFRKTLLRYWKEYFGRKSLNDVSREHMHGYEEWRQSYWKDKKKKKTAHPKTKVTVSRRTIDWEIGCFKQFLRWAKIHGKYVGNALEFRFDVGELQTRSAFTTKQWAALTGYMRRKTWLQVGKHGNDKRLIRSRKMLHAYAIFMVNTGLRVGEARNLCWQDLQFKNAAKSEDRKLFVAVAASQSKVRKRRTVVGTEGAYRIMKDYYDERKENKDFCALTDKIWCKENGSVIQHFREGFTNLLIAAGIRHDNEGKELTIYSLRHTFITTRLIAGVNPYQLAENCGTSIPMIEQYYAHARSDQFANELTKGYRK